MYFSCPPFNIKGCLFHAALFMLMQLAETWKKHYLVSGEWRMRALKWLWWLIVLLLGDLQNLAMLSKWTTCFSWAKKKKNSMSTYIKKVPAWLCSNKISNFYYCNTHWFFPPSHGSIFWFIAIFKEWKHVPT